MLISYTIYIIFGFGCYIGRTFYSVFGYADGLTLVAPSYKAHTKMITISKNYALDYADILFNPKIIILNCHDITWLPALSQLSNFVIRSLTLSKMIHTCTRCI